MSEDPIAIAQQIAWCRVPRKGFSQLARRPFGGRVSGDGAVENAPTIVGQHQEDGQNLKADRRYREEVDRNQALHMVLQERPPGLRWWFSPADQVFAHARFADIEAQLQQLTMNARRTPEWILAAHRTNPVTDLLRHRWSSRLSRSNLPSPEQAKALPVPADHRRGLDEEDTGPPAVPQGAQPSPRESIHRSELGPLHRALQNTELVAERQDFQLQRRTTAIIWN